MDGIRLHLADEVLPLWHAVQVETDDPDAPPPLLGLRLGGGLAIAHYLRRAPRGRRRAGASWTSRRARGCVRSPRCEAGASAATGVDIDPFAAAAIDLNARANCVRVTVVRRDVLDEEPPDADVVLAGDCSYEAGLARRVLPWLRRVRDRGIDVIVGDPGRRYLADDALERARPLRGPDDDRARGPRPQGRPRLPSPAAEITAPAGPKMPRSDDVTERR